MSGAASWISTWTLALSLLSFGAQLVLHVVLFREARGMLRTASPLGRALVVRGSVIGVAGLSCVLSAVLGIGIGLPAAFTVVSNADASSRATVLAAAISESMSCTVLALAVSPLGAVAALTLVLLESRRGSAS